MADEYLFVYGTLRSDCGASFNKVMRSEFKLIGKAVTRGKLYDIGNYPGIVIEDCGFPMVTGEVYQIVGSGSGMEKLDEYEESSTEQDPASEYYRTLRKVELEDGRTLEAWVYIYNQPIMDFNRIKSGNYAQYLMSGY